MHKKRSVSAILSTIVLTASLGTHSVPAVAAGPVPETGGPASVFRQNTTVLGFFNANLTGFGTVTESAVKALQKKAMAETVAIADSTASEPSGHFFKEASQQASRSGDEERKGYLVPWFGDAENILVRGGTATVYDIDTGLSFNIKRTYGTNHADCETLTKADTQIMKEIYGGSWSWSRRAVIITVDGRKLAASMAGMPHAGVEGKPANIIVSGRSEGYGKGENLDAVKNNGMSGHFDIHFLNSKTHGTNRVDPDHQAMVKKAAAWAMENLN